MSSEWRSTTVGELCQAVFSGGTPTSTNSLYFGGSIPWLRTKEVNYEKILATEQHISQAGYENSSAKLVPINSVIVAMYGNGDTAGRVAINKIPLTTNQACCNLVIDPTRADHRFVYYFLKGRYQELVDLKNGGAQQNLNSRLIKAFPISTPTLAMQHEIAALLEGLDDRIALLRETNATLEAIAQALFKSWFVDFDPVRAKQQGLAPAGMDEAAAALFPGSFEDSVPGSLPKEWPVAKLGDEATYLNRGISPKYLEAGGVRVLNQKCIRDFMVDVSKARWHDGTQRSITGRELRVGDVLVNSTGVGTLGRVAQVLALDETTIVDSHVTVVRAGRRLSWNYLGLAMMRRQAEIEALGEGSTGQTELNRGKLAGLEFVVPPDAILRAFDTSTIPLRMRMSANVQQAQTLATLRDTLLPRLISGQLRLPEAQAAMEEAA